jgi:predicted NBD/HSP70 family sugar kinase
MVGNISLLKNKDWARKNKRQMSILQNIWISDGISRKEIGQKLNITKVTVTNCVDKLIEGGLVEESTAVLSSERGRRPVPMYLKKDLFYSIGISFYDVTFARLALLNAKAEVISEKELHNLSGDDWRQKCDIVIEQIKTMLKEQCIELTAVAGIGISLTGIMRPEHGMVISSSQFEHNRDFKLCDYFKAETGKECFIINLPHLLAMMEHKWGKAKTMSSFLYFHHGYGVGMFLNGALYRGHQGNAGEVGMMQISEDGEQNADGRKGTVGMIMPFYKANDRIEQIIADNGNTMVRNYMFSDTSKVMLPMIVSAIKDGDRICAQLMSEYFEYVGKTVINLAYVFNPEAIFLPPWTANIPEVSIDIVRRIMGHYGVHNWGLHTDVLSAQYGDEDLVRGAGLLPINELLYSVRLKS